MLLQISLIEVDPVVDTVVDRVGRLVDPVKIHRDTVQAPDKGEYLKEI